MSTYQDHETGEWVHRCTDDCSDQCHHCGRGFCRDGDAESEGWRHLKDGGYLCPKCCRKFPRVLVIDDDVDLADVLKEGLDMEGFDALRAVSMAEVVDHIGKDIDVILLDQQGGDIDRQRVAAVAREMGIEVISMSGDASLRPMVVKPFRMPDLFDTIRRVMS